MLKVGSLFSGAGLCDLGLQWAGFEHQFFCEIDPWCRSILEKRWPGIPVYEDVKTLKGAELPHVDVLCGGFPCQDVSSAGKGAGVKPGTRSGLFYEYARIIGEISPKYAIIENVRGLLSNGIETVLQALAALGYDAEWEILPAAALGAPHHRERLFIVAYPHRDDALDNLGILHALKRILGDDIKPHSLLDWLGIRFERARKEAGWQAYNKPVLYRMDDGCSERLDGPVNVPPVPFAVAKEWKSRLKALGNGIVPHQAWAIGACILEAENLPVKQIPKIF